MTPPRSELYVFSLAALGKGISGGDRIFIELSRRVSSKIPVFIYVWEEGLAMCRREDLVGKFLHYKLQPLGSLSKAGFIFTYFFRIIQGLLLGFSLKLPQNLYVYSSSEFWMDSLPALLCKLRSKKTTWIAAWYQTAPNPLTGFSFGRYRFQAFFYWFMQLPIKPLVKNFADVIWVNNEGERGQFQKHLKSGNVHVMLGGVDTTKILAFQKSHPHLSKTFTAVFQGRFHPQKGVVELIDIWKIVITHVPDAKLALIGDGPLMADVVSRIHKNSLQDHVHIFGYLSDGDAKYKIFSTSRLVVHPAFYDSGGMAAAEAMAFGLPCVGFDLPAYESYYPEGMVKVPVGDLCAFAIAIISLLKDKSTYSRYSQAASRLVFSRLTWDQRANEFMSKSGILS